MSQPIDCQAMVFHQPKQPVTMQTIQIPRLVDGEVLVRVSYCTLCASDLHTFSGRRKSPLPSILGHEILGFIESTEGIVHDVQGQPLKKGDRVTWSVACSCHTCVRCQNHMPQKCETLYKYGHEVSDQPNGGLAQFCVLKAGSSIVRVPEGLSDKIACPANCATATVAAAIDAAGELAGKRVLVMGAGMLGLTAAAFSRVGQASQVNVCDLSLERLELAKTFGATETNTTIDGEYDVLLEMAGSSESVATCIAHAGIGAKIVLVGSVFPADDVAFSPESFVRRLIKLEGVHNYRPEHLVTAVNFLSTHAENFPFESLVSKEYSLEDATEAFEFAETNRPVRVAVVP